MELEGPSLLAAFSDAKSSEIQKARRGFHSQLTFSHRRLPRCPWPAPQRKKELQRFRRSSSCSLIDLGRCYFAADVVLLLCFFA